MNKLLYIYILKNYIHSTIFKDFLPIYPPLQKNEILYKTMLQKW